MEGGAKNAKAKSREPEESGPLQWTGVRQGTHLCEKSAQQSPPYIFNFLNLKSNSFEAQWHNLCFFIALTFPDVPVPYLFGGKGVLRLSQMSGNLIYSPPTGMNVPVGGA